MKNKIFTLLVVSLFYSCSNEKNESNLESNSLSIEVQGQNEIEIFGIDGSDIPIRTNPSKKSEKLVNQKATTYSGKTEYCIIDRSVKVKSLEESGTWTKIKVITPEWLSDSHIGWIETKYLLKEDGEEKQDNFSIKNNDYEIIKTDHNNAVENFYIQLNRKDFDEDYVRKFIKKFRKEKCRRNCNVNLYDTKTILSLIDKEPLVGKDYIKLADHYISMSTFDAPENSFWYPYQDTQYKNYGGKNWKKAPEK